jgi:raffinose/stachyose/melibiose transport system substrate-binding protein
MADSKREQVLNCMGLGLLVVCFLAAWGRIIWIKFSPDQTKAASSVTIRFAHWQLEAGVREAFDAIAAEYMKRHPNVRVEQIAVPQRIFPNWLITQLAGGTAPDIIALGFVTSESIARYFEPLSDLVIEPNPWNAGTDLQKVPLRDTFPDAMESGYDTQLHEYYGVPTSSHAVRIIYNLDLLREVTGAEDLPQTYDDLIDLAGKVAEYNQSAGRNIVPIAGSRYNAPYIMGQLYGSQTVGLSARLAYDAFTGISGARSSPVSSQLALAAARGEWSLDEPEIRAGLALQRDVGRYMQPGFMQASREDAGFYFTQGNALMISTGSWDLSSVVSQAPFRIAVGRIPYPRPGDPRAPFSLGAVSDNSAGVSGLFGMTRGSRQPEVARDFLLFLASQPMNQLFADLSKWPPAVVGVVPNEQAVMFAPFFDGYPVGFALGFSGTDSSRVLESAFHRLVGPSGSIDAFLGDIRGDYLQALAGDMNREGLVMRDNSQRLDTTLGALGWLRASGRSTGLPRAEERLDFLLQAVTATDLQAARTLKAANELNRLRR